MASDFSKIVVRLTSQQKAELDLLKEKTAVPTAIRMREAVQMLLDSYREVLNGEQRLPGMPARFGPLRPPED